MADNSTSGASKSLYKSIDDLEKIAKNKLKGIEGELREKFRDEYRKKLLELAIKWYKIGFQRGHKECYSVFKKTGTVPKKLTIIKTANFIYKTYRKKVKLQSQIEK